MLKNMFEKVLDLVWTGPAGSGQECPSLAVEHCADLNPVSKLIWKEVNYDSRVHYLPVEEE